MQAGILVIWAIGLAGALVPTIVILKLSRLVISTLHDLLALSRAIGVAARGIDKHASIVPTLPDLRPPARQLADVASAAGQSLQSIGRQLENLPGTR
jgi:hypothetical protein